MKVFFINTVYGRGSTGRIVADLGRALEESGHSFRAAYGRGDHSGDAHCVRVGSTAGMYLHAGLSRLTDRAGFYSAAATRELIEQIRQYSPDVIHMHNLHGYYLNVRMLFDYLADEYKGRIVWTLHDCWAFTGHCSHYTEAGCERWREACGNCPQKKEYPRSFLLDRSAKNLEEKRRLYAKLGSRLEIVTVSRWLEDQVRQSILSGASVRTIYNGVDTKRFRFRENEVKRRLGIGSKYMYLAVSDDWGTHKGYDKLFELSGLIGESEAIVVIGLNKKQIADLPKNVIGMEHTWDQDELIEFYSAADVLFNPSKEETFGLVTAEALACGTPAIVYDSTACPEVVGSKECGVILPPGGKLSDFVGSFHIDKSEYRDACERRVREHFSRERMLDEYLSLYFER